MAHSIIGYHFSTGGNKNGTGAWITAANQKGIPVFLKGVSDYGLLFEATATGNQYGVDNWLVYRMSKAAGTVSRETPNYTAEPGGDALGLVDEIISKLPPEFDKSKVWLEPINEPRGKATAEPVWNNLHPVDYLGEWMLAAAVYLNGKGYKVCGPSFNSGEPGDDNEPLSDAVLQYSLPGMLKYLTYCANNPTMAGLAVHEYIWDLPAPQYPQLWGRFEAAIAAADLNGIARTFPIFVTEWGYSRTNAPTYPAVSVDLDWYNKQAAKFPQVKGAAAWTLQSGYDPVDDQIITWTGYPIDKQFGGSQLPVKTNAVFGGTLPWNTPISDDVRSFEGDWTDLPLPYRVQVPDGFTAGVIDVGAPLWYPGGDVGVATGTVEALHKGCDFDPPNLPANQCAGGSDALVLHGNRCYKIQAVDMASGTFLKTTFQGEGRKRITVPVNVHWQKDTPNETDDVYVALLVNGIEAIRLQHPELKDRTWTNLVVEADAPATVELRFQTSYRNSRDLFTDKWEPEDITMPPTNETWQEEIWDESIERQPISLNPQAALQSVIFADGFTPVQSEFWYTAADDVQRACQAAENIETGERRVYYAVVPNWNNIQWFGDPEVSPPGPFDAPVGTEAERAAPTLWPGKWFDANPYLNYYQLRPGVYAYHTGSDLNLNYPVWDSDKFKPVYAVAAGTVTWAGLLSGSWGNVIVIKHDSCFSRYAHLDTMAVSAGQSVSKGEQIGTVGRPPGDPPGPYHLHFDISHTDILENSPGHWPGLDKQGVIDNYSDPKLWIEERRGDTTPTPTGISMAPYFFPASGDFGPICILVNNWGQGDERQQLQRVGSLSYVTKNQQWERRRADAGGIYFEMDTSPGDGEYYTVSGTAWLPNSWKVGDIHSRTERVTFYRKSDCAITNGPFDWTGLIVFKAHYGTWTSSGNVTLNDVIELAWEFNGATEETYWYAAGLGLVEWKNKAGKHSWLTEVIPLGQQDNNVREKGCYG